MASQNKVAPKPNERYVNLRQSNTLLNVQPNLNKVETDVMSKYNSNLSAKPIYDINDSYRSVVELCRQVLSQLFKYTDVSEADLLKLHYPEQCLNQKWPQTYLSKVIAHYNMQTKCQLNLTMQDECKCGERSVVQYQETLV